jgi:hypothetical protein
VDGATQDAGVEHFQRKAAEGVAYSVSNGRAFTLFIKILQSVFRNIAYIPCSCIFFFQNLALPLDLVVEAA